MQKLVDRCRTPAVVVGLSVMVLIADMRVAAIRTAAGGLPGGENGFDRATKFLDTIATYIMWIGSAAGGVGLAVGFVMLAIGDQNATTWLGRAAIGLAGALMVKAIAA